MTFIERIIALSKIDSAEIPASALTMARYSLLDWLACGRAGIDEPLAQKLRVFAQKEGGEKTASVFGADKVPARMAALVNGATSHALDYDDTHFGHIGHLSVGIYPAAIAAAEACELSAEAAIECYLIGAEAAIRIGIAMGAQHYNLGFHQTATAGAFGATVAVGRLLKLTDWQMRNALGLCATRASGLKSQFGTMGKPYNAGIAASNGIECAQLAALDFTSCDDGLCGTQGFFATHGAAYDEESAWTTPLSQGFLYQDNKYKLHACCHGLHAMIEALLAPEIKGLKLDDIHSLTIETNPRWLEVCDKKAPRTELEVKFSYAWLSGMTIRGDATSNNKHYTDGLAKDAELINFARKVTVHGSDALSDMQVRIKIENNSDKIIELAHDLSIPLAPNVLEEKLQKKAKGVIGVEGGRLWELQNRIEHMTAADIGELMSATQ